MNKLLASLAALVLCFALALMSRAQAAPTPDAAPIAAIDAGPQNGIGTSPSGPASDVLDIPAPTPGDAWSAFSAGQYALGIAMALLLALVLLRRAAPGLFSSDLAGAATALGSSFLGAIVTAAGTGAPFGWGMAKAAFIVSVLAMGGYSVLWKKLLKPLLYKVAVAAGWDGAARMLEGE